MKFGEGCLSGSSSWRRAGLIPLRGIRHPRILDRSADSSRFVNLRDWAEGRRQAAVYHHAVGSLPGAFAIEPLIGKRLKMKRLGGFDYRAQHASSKVCFEEAHSEIQA